MSAHPRYVSYLLRLWQVQNDQQVLWVASLHSSAASEQRMFRNVGTLLQFLQAEFGEGDSVDDSECQQQIDADSNA